tara:strand:+ start:3495 stop:5087 length:1593 start_codon:yes stop_codon:yes gene_type:complete
LTGAADDIVGRSAVKDAGLLMTLSPSDTLETTACFSDGSEAFFRVKSDGKKVSKPEHAHDLDTKQSLLLRQVRSVLASGTDTSRRAFLRWVGRNLQEEDILAFVPTNLHSKYRDWAEHIRGDDQVDTLLKIYDYAAKKQRDLGRQAQAARAVVQSLSEDVELGDSAQVGHLKEKISNHISLMAHAYTGSHLPEGWKHVDVSKQAVNFAIEQDLESCPLCGSNVGNEHFHRVLDYYLKACEDVDRTDQAAYLFEKNTELQEMLNQLADLSNKQGQRSSMMDTQAKVIELTQEAENYKLYKSQLSDTVLQLLRSSFVQDFCLQVSEYLPKNWRFSVRLNEGDRQVFRVGLYDSESGRVRCALSGAEWATVTSALAMCVADGLPETTPRVIIPEDRAWDKKTLAAVMRSFNSFDGQVLMASTIRPQGRTPKGWTIIDMDQWLEEEIEGSAEAADEQAELSSCPVDTEPERPVSSKGAKILTGLGYDKEQITHMNVSTAAAIIKQGLLAEYTHISSDGGYEFTQSSKLIKLPEQ